MKLITYPSSSRHWASVALVVQGCSLAAAAAVAGDVAAVAGDTNYRRGRAEGRSEAWDCTCNSRDWD